MVPKCLYALGDDIQKKTDMHYWQTQKSYEAMKFEFSNDYQAAILTGSEFFLTRCR